MGRWIIVASLAVSASARADHHGMAMAADTGDESTFGASVSVLAATFSPSQADAMFYGGNYQGVIAGGSWWMGRYAASASWAYYRLERNGAESTGVGDFVVHGQVAIIERTDVHAGVQLSASLPAGDEYMGLGMGHPMLMPAAWGAWKLGRVQLSGSAGYSWALATGGHVHGMAPLVEPMNMSEATWSAGGDVAIGSGVSAGARLAGGVPVGSMGGEDRVIGALRVGWGMHGVDTAAELQVGLVGDPFNIRGVVSTALRF